MSPVDRMKGMDSYTVDHQGFSLTYYADDTVEAYGMKRMSIKDIGQKDYALKIAVQHARYKLNN